MKKTFIMYRFDNYSDIKFYDITTIKIYRNL